MGRAGWVREGISDESQVFVGTRCVGSYWLIWDILKLFCWEIGRICNGAKVRNERGIDLPDYIPVNAIEEWMGFDMFHRKAMFLGCEESTYEVFCTPTKMNVVGEARWFLQSMIFLYVS